MRRPRGTAILRGPAGEAASPAQIRARIVLAVALVITAIWVGHDFVPAVLWAGVVAVALDPLMRRVDRRYPGHRTLVAAAMVAAIAIIVTVPLGLAAARAVTEAQSAAVWYAGARTHGIPVPSWIARLPYGSSQATTWWNGHLVTPAGANEQLSRIDTAIIIQHSRNLGQTVLQRGVVFAFSLLIAFFLMRDRDMVVMQLERAVRRAFGDAGPRLGRQILAGVRGAVDGLVLLGIAQGILMGVIMGIAGVPHAALFGVLAGVASVIPFGLIAVLLIAGALTAVSGSVGAAICVVVIGSAINFTIDHVIRPGLIGGSTHLPFVWVLIGIVGGVETIGLLGLFVGPAVMAALVMMWRDWVSDESESIERDVA